MALNEACQVWIEQRIEEELAERGDTGKSLREIGRELAAGGDIPVADQVREASYRMARMLAVELSDVLKKPISPATAISMAAMRLSFDLGGQKGGPQGYVYFIEGNGLIKIGYSTDPIKRSSQLQTLSPARLRLIFYFPGRPEDERSLHVRFKRHRVHGEWFERSKEIVEFIKGKQGEA